MALATKISLAVAKACADAVDDAVNGGAGAGKVEIRDGTQPTGGPDSAAVGTLFVTITLQDPAFGAADSNGRITMNGTPSAAAVATGTPTWFRAYDSNNVAVIDGSAGTGTVDMVLDSATITSGQTVTITSWTITMPKS